MDTNEKPASQQIDDIIHNAVGWKGETLARLRGVINSAGTGIAEEVKWKKPSKPEGVAVWSHNGNICVADVLKNAVRLTFPKGAQLNDPTTMFNTRLDSKTVRAVDFFENTSVDELALKRVVIEAIRLNS